MKIVGASTPGNRRARHPDELVQRAAHQRPDGSELGGGGHPTASLRRIALALQRAPIAMKIAIPARPFPSADQESP